MKAKRISIVIVLTVLGNLVMAQQSGHGTADLAATIGASQGSTALSYSYQWQVGNKKKLSLGVGGRLTNYFGTKKDFLSAGPAKYTRTFTAPFLIFFAGQEEQNFDTLSVQRPQVNSLNAFISVGYQFSKKWDVGFNIDVVGFSFGRKSSSVFLSNGITRIDPESKPVGFNVLLTGDHDRGTLNSELFLRYKLSEKWGLRAIYQFLFVEYRSESLNQVYSDGKTNDRFRNKVNSAGLGLTYYFK